MPTVALQPWFDDLYIYPTRRSDADSVTTGSSPVYEGIYYAYTGTAINITWIESRISTYESYIFSVVYDSASPGVVCYYYYVTGGMGSGSTYGSGGMYNDGVTAGIGAQGYDSVNSAYDAVQFSFMQASVQPGMEVECYTEGTPTCVGKIGGNQTVVAGVVDAPAQE